MNPSTLTKLDKIKAFSHGSPNVKIGVIDGPVDFNHPELRNTKINTVKESQYIYCKNASSRACVHGTFIAGILGAKRGSLVPAICPGCEILVRPVFMESTSNSLNNGVSELMPSSIPSELSEAIIETIDAGAKIINLSLGLSSSSLSFYPDLEEAYNYAFKKQVLIVAAAGNQGNVGNVSIIDNEWVIPVAACNEQGIPSSMSNFGQSIGRKGLLAPGINITSTLPEGKTGNMSGTSVAAPFVTGSLALLLSIFSDVPTNQIRNSVLNNKRYDRAVIPKLLDVESAFNWLKFNQ